MPESSRMPHLPGFSRVDMVLFNALVHQRPCTCNGISPHVCTWRMYLEASKCRTPSDSQATASVSCREEASHCSRPVRKCCTTTQASSFPVLKHGIDCADWAGKCECSAPAMLAAATDLKYVCPLWSPYRHVCRQTQEADQLCNQTVVEEMLFRL